MEKETFYCSFVGIQYIICECGENFPSEDSLKEHLETDHKKDAIEKPIKLEKKAQPKVDKAPKFKDKAPKPKNKRENLVLHYSASGQKPVYIVKRNDNNETLVVKLEDVESSLQQHLDQHHADDIKKEVIYELDENYVEQTDVIYEFQEQHAEEVNDQVVYELSPDDIQDGPHYVLESQGSDCEAPGDESMETILDARFNDEHCYDTKVVKIEEFFCEVCGKGYASERAVAAHVKRIHIGPYTKKTKTKYIQKKNSVCEVCGKKYASNAALRYHQRVHTGEKPYHCTECPKSFAMNLFLQMHRRMHTGERPYKCALCPKSFSRKAALNRHDKIHLRTHTGERPFECPHCPKAFSNRAALLRHDRVHTGEKPYVCPECNKAFTQSNSRKLHINTVHLKMPAPYKSRARRLKALQRQQGQAPAPARALAQQVEIWSGEEGTDNLVYHDDVEDNSSEVTVKEEYDDDSS